MEHKKLLVLKKDGEKSAGDSFEFDWSQLDVNTFDVDNIDKIFDPGGASTSRRITSYPTPIARMHFFDDAFQYVKNTESPSGNTIYHEAVSHCLDLWEIIFNYDVFQNKVNSSKGLEITEWDYTAIDTLASSPNSAHKLLGKSLELFLKNDKTKQLDKTTDKLYLISYNNNLLGGSSPFTGFFAVDFDKDKHGTTIPPEELTVPGTSSVIFFKDIRGIAERDEEFQEYMFRIQKSQGIADYWVNLYNYIDTFKKKTDTINRIDSVADSKEIRLEYEGGTSMGSTGKRYASSYAPIMVSNAQRPLILLNNVEIAAEEEDVQQNEDRYSLSKKSGVEIKKRIIKIPDDCSFIIDTPKEKYREQKLLALKDTPDSTGKFYIGANWDNGFKVPHFIETKDVTKRSLPSWNVAHPYLVLNDLLEEYLIEVPYYINDTHFHICNSDASDVKYLLPIKPKYFELFDIEDLNRHFSLKVNKTSTGETVVATLSIPLINNNRLTFTREYKKNSSFRNSNQIHNSDKGLGHILEYEVGIMVFPFFKTDKAEFNNLYKVGCVDNALSYPDTKAELRFFNQNSDDAFGYHGGKLTVQERVEKTDIVTGTKFFEIKDLGGFDYMQVQLSVEGETIQNLIIPKWKKVRVGEKPFTFAVDFGTSNTHVAFRSGDQQAASNEISPFTIGLTFQSDQAISVHEREGDFQAVRLDKPSPKPHATTTEKYDSQGKGRGPIDEITNKQRYEFIPNIIGEEYSFPIRTVLSETNRTTLNDSSYNMLGNANIAFSFNRRFELKPDPNMEDTWRHHTNLKWENAPNSRARLKIFLEEILYLIRNKVILSDGDPSKTTIYWFTPLSMNKPTFQRLEREWLKLYQDIFATKQHPIRMTESEAPFYDAKSVASGQTILSIDIGGMTTDLLLRGQKGTIWGSSFRFAGNAVFGDFPDPSSNPKNNGLVKSFKNEIKGKLDKLANSVVGNDYKASIYSELKIALDWYFQTGNDMKSDDLISFYFALDELGFEETLAQTEDFKVVFLLHFTGLMYHCAQMVEAADNPVPTDIYLSGNGSKMYNIISNSTNKNLADLEGVANEIFKYVLDLDDDESEEIDIKVWKSEKPKEATCNGALKSGQSQAPFQTKDLFYLNLGEDIVWVDGQKPDDPKYDDLLSAVQKNFKPEDSEYYKFVELFIELYHKLDFKENFGLNFSDINVLKTLLKKDMKGHINRGITWVCGNAHSSTEISETMFFYPLMGAIMNILEELHKKKNGQASVF